MPSKITINTEEQTIVSESEKFRIKRSISQVVKVVDMGEWYQFYFDDKVGRFVCQKDLISLGTLDDFERLFADKLQR